MVDEETETILEANNAAVNMYGYSKEELIGMKAWELSAEPEKTKADINLKGKKTVDLPLFYQKRKDGSTIIVKISARHYELQGKKVNISTIRDITDSKKIEYSLQEAEAEKKAILNSIAFNLIFLSTDFNIIWANKAAAESINKKEEQLIGHKCYEFWGEGEKICIHCPTKKALKSKRTVSVNVTTKEGHTKRIVGSPVSSPDGVVLGAIDMAEDITERKRAENKIAYEQSLMQLLFENIPDLVFFKDRNRKFVHVSDSFCNLLGCNHDYIVGKTDEDIFSKEVSEELSKDDGQVIENGTSIINKKEGSYALILHRTTLKIT